MEVPAEYMLLHIQICPQLQCQLDKSSLNCNLRLQK